MRQQLEAISAAEGGSSREGLPERWLQNPTWRCVNAHVAKRCNQGRRGRRECVYNHCSSTVQLTFPEDRSGPLR